MTDDEIRERRHLLLLLVRDLTSEAASLSAAIGAGYEVTDTMVGGAMVSVEAMVTSIRLQMDSLRGLESRR